MIKTLNSLLCLVILLGCNSTNINKVGFKPLIYKIESRQLLHHFETLSSDTFQGRKVSTQGSIKAQKYIIEQLHQLSIAPFNNKFTHSFEYNVTFSKSKGSNIIGYIEGTDKNLGYIVLTAHFDHLGTKGKQVFNGADDNASGVSSLLSISEQLAKTPLKHNVIILFTDAEENGLKGSKAFLKENQYLLSQIRLNVNMDMLAGSKNSKRLHYIHRGLNKLLSKESIEKFVKNHNYRDFSVIKGFRKERHALNKHTSWVKASDHGVFYSNGIPFIYYGVGTHRNYHSQHDEFINTNHQLLINSTNAIFQQLLFLDQTI